MRARRLGRRYGRAISPARQSLALAASVGLVCLAGCTKRSGDLATPQRVDGGIVVTTTTLPFTGTSATTGTTGGTSTTTAMTSTSASTTAAPTTTRAPASSTSPTTAPPRSISVPPPTTVPANLTLTVTQSNTPCPALLLSFVAAWSIGNAAPGTGRLAFDSEAARPVPDAGREERCVAAGTHSYTFSAAVAGGRVTRTATFSWS